MTINDGELRLRELQSSDWPAVLEIYAQGIATGNATFETETPSSDVLEHKWLAGHRWVAAIGAPVDGPADDGAVGRAADQVRDRVVGWAALTPVSARECYAGVAETSVYVGAGSRGRGVGKALVQQQISAADGVGLWTLQTSIFPENEASIALHVSLGFRIVGRRERIAQHHGIGRDTILLERRAPATT